MDYHFVNLVLALLAGIFALLRLAGVADRNAKEKALSLLQAWAHGITTEMRLSREISESINFGQNTCLADNKSILLTDILEKDQQATLFLACNKIIIGDPTDIEKHLKRDDNGCWIVPISMVMVVNAHLLAYLNLTEVILAAAKTRVAKQSMIFEELKPVSTLGATAAKPRMLCAEYRGSPSMKDAFPAIDQFVKQLGAENLAKDKILDRLKRFFWF